MDLKQWPAQWLAPASRVEQFDEPDGIRFRVTRTRRPADLIIPILAAIVLTIAWQLGASGLLLLGAAALIGFPLYRWFDVRSTELRVTELDLVAEGDLDSTRGTAWVEWTAIHQLRHLRPEDGHAGGLYADTTCLLPAVSKPQVTDILWAIYSRYPSIKVAERSAVPTLGLLNNRDRPN
jgi:hypothetical protein